MPAKFSSQYSPSDGDIIFAKQHLEDMDLRNSPESVKNVVRDVLNLIAKGKSVRIAEESEFLSPAEAARLLNVSRTYFLKLLDKGEIPFSNVPGGSTHRRIRRQDVIDYEEEQIRQAEDTLSGIVRESEELGLYEE